MSSAIAEELRQLRRRKPFQPFRVHLKNGETYDVLDDVEILIGDIALVLPFRDPPGSDKGYGIATEVGQVARIELLTPLSATMMKPMPEEPREVAMSSAMSSAMEEELRQLRRKRPFQPFRVYLKNGEIHEVLNPFEFGVFDFALLLPVHHPTDPDKDYGVSLSVDQVDRIELLAPLSKNGRSQ